MFPAAKTALTVLGGALLLWFALRYLRRAWFWSNAIGRNHLVSPREAFLITLGILATNPKALTNWMVLISIFPAARAGPVGIMAMIVGATAIASLGHLAYGLAFSTRRAAEAYARMGRRINAGVGLFFASLGITLLLRVTGMSA